MSVPALQPQELLGLFELDESGAVLYSSIEGSDSSLLPSKNLKGLNFFSQVATFQNADELKRRFEMFKCDGVQASSFDFTLQYSPQPVTVRILLARLRDQVETGRMKSLLMHIRKQ